MLARLQQTPIGRTRPMRSPEASNRDKRFATDPCIAAARRGLLHPPDRAIVDGLGSALAIRAAALGGDAIAGASALPGRQAVVGAACDPSLLPAISDRQLPVDGVMRMPRTQSSASATAGATGMATGRRSESASVASWFCMRPRQRRCRSRGEHVLHPSARHSRGTQSGLAGPKERDVSVGGDPGTLGRSGVVLRERGRHPRPAARQAALAAIRGKYLRFERRLPRE